MPTTSALPSCSCRAHAATEVPSSVVSCALNDIVKIVGSPVRFAAASAASASSIHMNVSTMRKSTPRPATRSHSSS